MNRLFDVGSNKQLQNSIQTYSLGAGLKFDGVNDFVNVNTNYEISGDFEVSFSFIFKKPTFNGTLLQVGISDEYPVHLFSSSATIFNSYNGDYVFYNYPVTSGDIINVVVTRNFNINRENVFVDGILIGTRSISYRTLAGQFLRIGFNPYQGFFNGIIYDLKIFKKVLSQVEVTELFNNKGSQIPITAQSNLVADYRFNQKSGITLFDNSINANNGSLINFANTTPSAGNAWVDDLGNSILI